MGLSKDPALPDFMIVMVYLEVYLLKTWCHLGMVFATRKRPFVKIAPDIQQWIHRWGLKP